MPCNTITKVSLNMSGLNVDRMKRALESMGYVVRQDGSRLYGTWGKIDTARDGSLKTRGGLTAGTVRQAYTGQVVKDQARRLGWGVKETGRFTYEVIKR